MADQKEQHDKLRGTLDQLQAQLDEMRASSPAVAQHLDSLIAESRAALENPAGLPARRRSIVQRLSDAVLKYEASHPILATSLGNIIDALAQLGI